MESGFRYLFWHIFSLCEQFRILLYQKKSTFISSNKGIVIIPEQVTHSVEFHAPGSFTQPLSIWKLAFSTSAEGAALGR